jgi:hypothetical protein
LTIRSSRASADNTVRRPPPLLVAAMLRSEVNVPPHWAAGPRIDNRDFRYWIFTCGKIPFPRSYSIFH